MQLTEADLRAVGRWAADCAARVLPLFEAEAPGDARPAAAIAGIREFARGGKRTARLRTLALAAYAAARDMDSPAATAAARAAGLAASSAYTHPLATTDQARHILGPAVYAALAREHAAGPAAATREVRWATRHVTPVVREILRRYPAQRPGRTRLATLFYQLDVALRG